MSITREEMTAEMAIKIRQAVKEKLTAEELESTCVGGAMWLAMQMLCGPYGAAREINSCRIQ